MIPGGGYDKLKPSALKRIAVEKGLPIEDGTGQPLSREVE